MRGEKSAMETLEAVLHKHTETHFRIHSAAFTLLIVVREQVTAAENMEEFSLDFY